MRLSPAVAPGTGTAIQAPAQSPVERDTCDIECEIHQWKDKVHAREVEITAIPFECHNKDYDIGIYSFANHGSHFILVATESKSEIVKGDNDNCPAVLVLTSIESRKVSFRVPQQHFSTKDFNVHMLSQVSLDQILEAERSVYPIDEEMVDILHHYCAKYTQDILDVLNIEMTSEVANFMIDNMLRDYSVIDYAKKEGGEEEGMAEQYVKDSVLTQLGIM